MARVIWWQSRPGVADIQRIHIVADEFWQPVVGGIARAPGGKIQRNLPKGWNWYGNLISQKTAWKYKARLGYAPSRVNLCRQGGPCGPPGVW